MTPIAGSDYLQTEVLTATPQRLQLMLIDAAIRSTNRRISHRFVWRPLPWRRLRLRPCCRGR